MRVGRYPLCEDACYDVVVVGFGDLAAVEVAGDEGLVGAEVVDEDLAVDLGGVELGAPLPEEIGLFAEALDEQIKLAPDPLLLALGGDRLLEFHEAFAARLDSAPGEFAVQGKSRGAFFIGVGEGPEPVDPGLGDEGFELCEVVVSLAGEAYDEGGAEDEIGDDAAGLFDHFEEDFCAAAALHALEDGWGCVLERHVEVAGDVGVAGDGFEQSGGDLVGVRVEEAEPLEVGDAGERVEQVGEAVPETEVFAVAGGVLADEGDLADALVDEVFRLGDHRGHAAGAEFSAELGNDAEAAGMVAALGDLDVCARPRRSEDARGLVGVEVIGQGGDGSGPVFAAEAALALAQVAFGPGLAVRAGTSRGFLGDSIALGTGVFVDGAGGAGDQILLVALGGFAGGEDVEGRVRIRGWGNGEPGGGENGVEFAGADDGVYLGDILLDFVAVTLDQAAGDDESPGGAGGFVADHLKDGVDGLLFGGVDEGAGVDDEDFSVFGGVGEARTGAVKQAHHHFGIDEVFGAAEGDEADFRRGGGGGCGHKYQSICF